MSDINEIVDQLRRRKSVGLQLFLEDGQLLTMAVESKEYKKLGEHVKTEADFFKEIGMSRTEATNRIRVWKRFGEKLESQRLGGSYISIDPSRLIALLPIAQQEDDIEWLHKASLLLPQEFKDAVREARGKVTSTDCPHDEHELHSRCKGCGKWLS